jgi:hypothetical protein
LANLRRPILAFIAAIVLSAGLSGCGGGADGSAEGNIFPSKTLSWNPPTTYSDFAPLDPAQDLEMYEIYVDETGAFSDAASPMAEVASADRETGELCTSFDLANLGPYLSPGVTYYVSVRAVAASGLKSGFSDAATFSF